MAVSYTLYSPDQTSVDLSSGGLAVTLAQVYGAPPVALQTAQLPFGHGEVVHNLRVTGRTVTVLVDVAGTSYANMLKLTHSLTDILRVNRSASLDPWRLRATVDAKSVELRCYPQEVITEQEEGFQRVVGLRLYAPDPFWYAVTNATEPLTWETGSTGNYLAVRVPKEGWQFPGWPVSPGGAQVVTAALCVPSTVDPLGRDMLYVGGLFVDWENLSAADNLACWDGENWFAMSTGGMAGQVYALAAAPNGSIFVGGGFTAFPGIAGGAYITERYWTGTGWAWRALAGGANGPIYALTVGPDGRVYAGGAFTQIGGVAADRVAVWNGSGWSALGAGADAPVWALAVGPDGALYAGGQFVTAGGVTVNHVARFDGTWQALGGGADGIVRALAFGVDGTLFMGGQFAAVDDNPASNAAMWNGAAWRPLGAGTNGEVHALQPMPSGEVVVAGYFSAAGGMALPDSVALWTGFGWRPLDIDFQIWSTVYALALSEMGALYLGGNFKGTHTFCGLSVVTYTGTVGAWPQIEITGPGRVLTLRNESTGRELAFDLVLQDGEKLTIDLTPGHKSVVSNWRGNLLGSLLDGSALSTWALEPAPMTVNGYNTISLYMTGTGANTDAAISWQARYWAADDGVGA